MGGWRGKVVWEGGEGGRVSGGRVGREGVSWEGVRWEGGEGRCGQSSHPSVFTCTDTFPPPYPSCCERVWSEVP